MNTIQSLAFIPGATYLGLPATTLATFPVNRPGWNLLADSTVRGFPWT